MEFINQLVEREETKRERELLKDAPGLSLFKQKEYHIYRWHPIDITDRVRLSTQAGFGAYSDPDYTQEKLSDYRSWEVGFLVDGVLTSVADVFPDYECLDLLQARYNEPVYPNVPVQLVEDLYQALLKNKDILKLGDPIE